MIDDNDWPQPAALPPTPDAHGQAALLLVESLIHALVAGAIIGSVEAVEIVTIAIDAKIEIAADSGEDDDVRDRPLALLSSIRTSLGADRS